jgi:ABC-type transport system substrate-binding protein
MTEVFGYEYDEGGANGTEVPYFQMVEICPTTNTARTQWASLIARAWTAIGIDVVVKWLNWNILTPRIYSEPAGHGFDYEHGGYDVYFAGWGSTNPDPDWQTMYATQFYPPNGQNTGWIENNASDDIWTRAVTDPDPAVRMDALYDFQEWYFDTVPKILMPKQANLFAIRNEWSGFDVFHKGYYFQNLTSSLGSTDFVYVVPGDFKDLNPIYSNSYYDIVPLANCHEGVGFRPSDKIRDWLPNLYESYTVSADGLTYTAKMREGVKFSDGSTMTVDDIIFSYHSQFDEDLGAPQVSTFLEYFNNTGNIKKLNDTHVELKLVKFYPYPAIIGTTVLKKAQMELIDVANWKTDDTNTKTTPIGLGPYMFDTSFGDGTGYDGVDTIKLVPNPHYNGTLLGHDPSKGIWKPQPSVTSVTIKVVKDATSAVTGLSTGIYDILDENVGVQAQAEAINNSDYGYISLSYGLGWQECTFNHYSPIFGMNPGDPRQMYPTEATPFDFTGVLMAIVVIAGFQIFRKRK